MYRQGFYQHTVPARPVVGTANASGVAVATLGPVAQNFCWYLERISTNCPTAGTTLEVFVAAASGVTDEGFRQEFTPTANNDIIDEINPIYIPAGYLISLRWASATSGDLCSASLQYSVHQLQLNDYSESPTTIREHAQFMLEAAHQIEQAPPVHQTQP